MRIIAQNYFRPDAFFPDKLAIRFVLSARIPLP